ncbi:MAG: hypothetical protein HQK79_18295 [Desulfobacterales bacterium]|nr:hypothetical protein [Desulfobacterales bacterium]MBF0397774.1 hypothetical protein [Desulfobacterales bacterium]
MKIFKSCESWFRQRWPKLKSRSEKNIDAVKAIYDQPIIPMIVTHIAHPKILKKTTEKGILVIQSFDWIQ